MIIRIKEAKTLVKHISCDCKYKFNSTTCWSLYWIMYICGLSKIFYTVDDEILLSKLDYFGIQGISNNWFKCNLFTNNLFL